MRIRIHEELPYITVTLTYRGQQITLDNVILDTDLQERFSQSITLLLLVSCQNLMIPSIVLPVLEDQSSSLQN